MKTSFTIEGNSAPSPSHKRLLLIVVLIFGIAGFFGGVHWLTSGSIVIRQGSTRVGSRTAPRPVSQPNAPVAGSIASNHLLYYPICFSWIGLGASMVTLSVLSFFTASEIFPRLAAWSCAALLLLAFGTVAAAIWLGSTGT